MFGQKDKRMDTQMLYLSVALHLSMLVSPSFFCLLSLFLKKNNFHYGNNTQTVFVYILTCYRQD